LIKGRGRFLLIDTGMNREECLSVMSASLKRLEVNLAKTDFFISHLHADHLGLVGTLSTATSKVYFNKIEASMVNASHQEREQRWQRLFNIFVAHGFPEAELRQSVAGHPGRRYSGRAHLTFSLVKEGDIIEVGNYAFRCLETPGHSPGHLCLYEADRKILVSGDHILFDITPNITFWEELGNSLKSYLESLQKIYDLEVSLVLPGHRSPAKNHQKRIQELRAHHKNRLNEVLSALKEGGKTVFQVAPYVTWNVQYDSWAEFPSPQKWFAFGETLAHLRYLEAEGMVREAKQGSRVLFLLV
jgi:glyoxylase-like metal-dependent hydrolase (beta-lactamase superfamily II)